VSATDFAAVLCTIGKADDADRLADALVGEGLAGCVNIVGPIRSVYTWEGSVQSDAEYLLIMKIRCADFEAVSRRVHELHPYDTPEVIALPIVEAAEKYLAWLSAATERRQR